MNFKQVKGVKERDPCTIVSWASAHSQVSTYVTVLAVQMESALSQASAQVMWAIDDEAGENTYEDDSDVYLDPFSDSAWRVTSPNFQAQLYIGLFFPCTLPKKLCKLCST